jgi:DNA-directed RNA polymerase specialized sigma24 family protein
MSEASGGRMPGSDAELLNTIRSGDSRPFDLLRGRHAAAARYLAGHLVRGPAAADTVVELAFARVLDAIQRGGGPTDAFRPYLLTAVRRAASEGAPGGAPVPTDEQQIPDPGQLLIDPAVASLEGSPVVPAFLSLPERWRAVLWHTDIEGATPVEAAPLLGLSTAGVTELAGRARDGLARAYLRLRQAAGEREPDALADVGAALRQTVAPIILGGAAAAYLAGLAEAGVAGPARTARPGRSGRSAGAARRRTAAGSGARPGAGRATAAGPTGGTTAGWLRRSTTQQRAVAAGAAALLAMFGIGGYVLSLGSGDGAATAGHAAADTSSAPAPAQTPSSSPRPSPAGRDGSAPGGPPASGAPGRLPPSATPIASAPARPRPDPRPPARRRRPQAQVTTQVSVFGPWGDSHIAVVVFTIADAGPAATSGLTAYISLPRDASMMSEGRDGRSGWSCRGRRDGASCVHAPIAAAGRTGGMIAVQVTGSAACGQPVRVSVSGGASTASARSAGTIQCGGSRHHHWHSWAQQAAAGQPRESWSRSSGQLWPAQQWLAQQWPAQQWPAQQWPAQQWPAQQDSGSGWRGGHGWDGHWYANRWPWTRWTSH